MCIKRRFPIFKKPVLYLLIKVLYQFEADVILLIFYILETAQFQVIYSFPKFVKCSFDWLLCTEQNCSRAAIKGYYNLILLMCYLSHRTIDNYIKILRLKPVQLALRGRRPGLTKLHYLYFNSRGKLSAIQCYK